MAGKNRRRLENAGSQDTYYAGSLPEIVVTGNRRTPYRSYYQEANDRFLGSLGNAITSAVGNFGDALGEVLWYPIKGALSLADGGTKDSYHNATIPYGQGPGHERDNIIQVKNGVAGQMDRLGMYGAVKGEDGVYRFRDPNHVDVKNASNLEELRKELGFSTNREFLTWCAENANRLNSSLDLPTSGNAWTRHGIYGDSVIIQSPNKKSDYWFGSEGVKAKRLASDQGKYVSDNIDNHELKTGDIVDMYYKGSDYQNRAFKEGDNERTNSHTGTILKTGHDKEHTYVVHSTGNGLRVDPIGTLLGSGFLKKSYITGIRRPGSKNHKYK